MKHNINKGDRFTCAACGEEFKSSWDAKDAQAQYEKEFPDRDGENTSIVCEECYQLCLKWKKTGSKQRSVN